jgi:hypothetical protein
MDDGGNGDEYLAEGEFLASSTVLRLVLGVHKASSTRDTGVYLLTVLRLALGIHTAYHQGARGIYPQGYRRQSGPLTSFRSEVKLNKVRYN